MYSTISFNRFLQRWRLLLGLGVLAFFATHGKAHAAPEPLLNAGEAVLRAHQLFSSNVHSSADIRRLQALAQQSNGHPLHEYVESWALRMRLSNVPNVSDDERTTLFDEIADWLQQHPGSLAADLLRRDWLLKLGEAEAWPLFDAQLAQWTLNDEPDVRCYALLSRYQKEAAGQAAAAELMPVALLAREPLLSQRALGPGCIALTRALVNAGLVPRDVLWQRLRLLSEGNYGTAMRRVAEHLSEPTQPALDQIIKSAAHWLAHHPATVRDATDQELLVLALVRMAPGAPEVAAAQADSALFKQLTPAQQAYVWSRIALSAARELKPAALAWFDRAQALAAQSTQNTMPPLQFADEVYEWHARTALRAQDWDAVRRSIERMPASLQSEHAWIYWLGRAYQAQGMADKARAQYMRLALQYTFYAKLAQEELGLNIVTPPRAAAPTAEEIQAAEDSPHFRRALAFYQLDLIMEAKREWNWGCRGLNDRQLLAAADLASRHEILDRSINAAERTRLEHDFALRFPSPHRALMQEQASRLNLDSATIYGLIRQESRFAQIAQSSAGAHGLMQLMPHTAHWVAQKLGLKDYRKRDLSEIETNIVLGTNYFRMVLDDLDQSVVLASAAYNAGPRRSRDWRASLKAPVEGAIFAETIPFSETRDYVKQVLSNAVDYAALWEGKPQSIKARLGTIAPKDTGSSELP